MRRATLLAPAVIAALALIQPSAVRAQEEAPQPLEIGAVAPDFALPGATRYGVLAEPIRLSDFKGRTVVLAFFFRARTRG